MSTLRFLLLEDNPLDAEMVQTLLLNSAIDFELLRVETRADFVAALETDEFDLILADYALPNFDGISALEIACNLRPDIPFIFVSANLGEELAIETLKRGAIDYVLKQRLGRLVPCVDRALQEAKERRELKQTEAALRQNEAHLRAVAANLPNGAVFLVDHDLRYLLAEGDALQSAGMTSEDLVGKTLWEALDPALATRYEPHYRQALGGEPFSSEHCSHDRTYISHGTPLRNDRGEVDTVLVVSYDITDRKRTELNAEFLAAVSQELVRATRVDEIVKMVGEHLNRYLNTSTCAFVEISEEARQAIINHDWHQNELRSLVGVYPLGEFVTDEFLQAAQAGQTIVVRDVTADSRIVDQQRYAALKIGAEINVPLIRDGQWKFSLTVFHQAPYDWREDEIELMQELANRIWTKLERARAEAALRQSEEQSWNILESINDAFFALDKNWLFTYVNQTAETLLDRAPGDLTRKNFWEEFSGLNGSEFERLHRRVMSDRVAESLTAFYPDHDRWYEVRTYPAPNGITVYFRNVTDRIQAEAELRESEARFRHLADTAPVLIWMSGTDKLCYYFNQPWLDFTGRTMEQEMGNSWAEGVHPDDFQLCLDTYVTAFDARQPFQMEYRLRRSDGAYRWLLDAGVPRFTSEGEFLGYIGSCIDIDDRKSAEAALRESEARFRLVVESAKEYAIFTLDSKGAVTSWNSGAERLFGYQAAEILDCNSRILYTPEDNEWGRNERERQTSLAQGQAENECWHIRKDGSRFWGSGLVMPLQTEAGPQGFVKIMQDKTVQRQAGERFRLLYDTTSDLLATEQPLTLMHNLFSKLSNQLELDYYYQYTVEEKDNRLMLHLRNSEGLSDETAQLIEWIEFGQDICGLVAQERRQMIFDQAQVLAHPNAQRLRAIGGTAYAGQPLIVQGRLLGTLSFASRRRTSFTSEEIDLLQSTCDQMAIALERTNLIRSIQQQAEQLQRANRIKDEFLAVLSHELRSPLNPILGWTKLLRAGRLDHVKTSEALATIERNAKLQSQLIEDLLDISRIMQGKLSLTATPVSLTFVISAAIETVRLAAEAKNVGLQLDLDSTIAPVSGDVARLQQVVWNLLSNAVKFTPSGGQVTLELRQLDQLAQISVIDTGKGINAQFLPYVFEYFRQEDGSTTRRFGGLGLGLAIVRQIVEMHGGTVEAKSAGEDQGATFIVKLPMVRQIAPIVLEPIRTQTDLETPLDSLQILLVDDDTDTREFQAFLLEQSGARVTAVVSGLEALQALERFIPDLIVSDVGMAEMDGYMLMQQIRSRPPRQGGTIPAIALTAYAAELDQQKALQAGFQIHMTKPVEPEILVREIINLLNSI
ncbi:PAS domain S-box protein [Phormidesmis priestleyi ULC007]|uniref:Circadian input-output histidine kinase CikA n=1 Tax=Phormidesmis priestleyi ULC007 TaxID=1920490 RepID=A0A2T1DFB4_9CYAN|nr:PAS domain S-box protein [Phormidesmis priestleyi]PSB19166.1 PAS domain S-box protein [Phormidesmis priestleyi ULC007]PZO50018.1 MAG: PAS domain S-box protein [Phormidesmis priestleyi]